MKTGISRQVKISLNSTVVAAKSQVSSDLGGETAILNLDNGVYYSLNSVGTRIWELIQESITVSQIREIIFNEYEVTLEQCEQDILTLLEKLWIERLVEVSDETTA